MRTTSFTSFAQKYAQAMSGRNIPVTFGGKVAWTDNKRINLPALPAGTMLSQWEAKVLTGYLDHEVGHVLYTDWKEMPEKRSTPRPKTIDPERKKKLLTFYLFNLFEDVREENAFIKDMPPVKSYLDAVEQELQYRKRENDNEQKPSGAHVLEAIYHEAYSEYRKPDVVYEPGPNLDQFPELAPIKEALQELATMQTTKDARLLAEKVYDLLPKDKDYGQNVELNEEGLYILVPGLPGEGDEEIFFPLEVIEQAIKESNRPDALQEMLAQIVAANEPKGKPTKLPQKWGDRILPPVSTAQDRIFIPTNKNRPAYEAVRAQVSDQINAAKKMLTLALRARTKRAWEKGLPEGQLDGDQLASLFTGNTDVFKEKRTTQLVDTAVQLMVDLSGSMDENSTKMATLILGEALQGIKGIKLSIAGFTTKGGRIDPTVGKGSGLGRNMALEIPLFKDFDEAYVASRDRLGALKTLESTPLGDAFALGMERLLPRKEPRKVLWVITDGQPSLSVADSSHNEYLLMEKTYRRCREGGVKVVLFNIGFLDQRAAKCADVTKSVSNPAGLPAAMLEMTKGISL